MFRSYRAADREDMFQQVLTDKPSVDMNMDTLATRLCLLVLCGLFMA